MAKVDIGSETYDAYADVDYADVHLAADVFRGPQWAAITDPDAKGRGLVSAARLMAGLPWVDPAPTYDDAPAIVKDVNSMLAADLLANPKLVKDASGNSNVKAAGAGSARVEFFKPVEDGTAIPSNLYSLLVNAGLVSGVSTGDEVAGPIVTGNSACRPLYGRPYWDYPIAAKDTM